MKRKEKKRKEKKRGKKKQRMGKKSNEKKEKSEKKAIFGRCPIDKIQPHNERRSRARFTD